MWRVIFIACLLSAGCSAVQPRAILTAQSMAQPMVTITPFNGGASLVNYVWIEWTDDDPAAASFNLYWSDTGPHVYEHVMNTTNKTCVVSNFPVGATWYFAATALDSNGVESDFSDQYAFTMKPALDITFDFPQPATNISVQSSTDLNTWQPRVAYQRSNGVWRVDINSDSPMEFYRGIGQVIPTL